MSKFCFLLNACFEMMLMLLKPSFLSGVRSCEKKMFLKNSIRFFSSIFCVTSPSYRFALSPSFFSSRTQTPTHTICLVYVRLSVCLLSLSFMHQDTCRHHTLFSISHTNTHTKACIFLFHSPTLSTCISLSRALSLSHSHTHTFSAVHEVCSPDCSRKVKIFSKFPETPKFFIIFHGCSLN